MLLLKGIAIASQDDSSNSVEMKFQDLRTFEDVANLLGIDKFLLELLLRREHQNKKYRVFHIRKKSGGERQICAPTSTLKYAQYKLCQVLSNVYKPKPSVHGFTQGKSILTNAQLHLQQKCLLNLDLKDFFPSITFVRVRGMFIARPYKCTSEVATALAGICCYNNQLPQGAPTSPIISNMICARLDGELYRLARDNNCTYSRYADDITFSTFKSRFSPKIAYFSTDTGKDFLGSELLEVIHSNGFTVNEPKTRLRTRYQHQEVTGITVNEKPNLSRVYIRNIRAMLHAWEKFGLEAAEAEFHRSYDSKQQLSEQRPQYSLLLRGRIEHVGYIRGYSDPIYQKFLKKLKELSPSLVKDSKFIVETELAKQNSSGKQQIMPLIYTEGKTDIKHLKAALRKLKQEGHFADLVVDFYEETVANKGGSGLLAKRLEHFPSSPLSQPVIAIFDRDEPDQISKIDNESVGYKTWGKGVYSFAIPVPHHRRNLQFVSIEHYYSDNEIETLDSNDRRLYCCNEFNFPSGINKQNNTIFTTSQKCKKAPNRIIDSEVFSHPDGQPIALSKDDFASNIYSEVPGFNCFDFKAFIEVFKLVEKIIEVYRESLSK
jgi:RNA-directed DNA polymerase